MEGREFVAYDPRMFPLADAIACECGLTCDCGASEALIGPAQVRPDGSVDLHWRHAKPAARLVDVIAEFGTPNIVDTSPGGMARWGPAVLGGTPYTEIILKDEEIPHALPMPHEDYLYSSVCVNLDRATQIAMMDITKSVWYDRLTHTLTARCHYMQANVATLLLVTQLGLGEVSAAQAPGLYGGMIASTKDAGVYAQMKAQLAHNLHLLGCGEYGK